MGFKQRHEERGVVIRKRQVYSQSHAQSWEESLPTWWQAADLKDLMCSRYWFQWQGYGVQGEALLTWGLGPESDHPVLRPDPSLTPNPPTLATFPAPLASSLLFPPPGCPPSSSLIPAQEETNYLQRALIYNASIIPGKTPIIYLMSTNTMIHKWWSQSEISFISLLWALCLI